MSQTPRIPLSCSQKNGRRSVHVDAGNHLGVADPRAHLFDRSEEPQGRREFVPAVVKEQRSTAEPCLLKLSLVGVPRNVPPAAPAGHHLEVIAHHLTDLATLYRGPEFDQRFIEEIVLHHAQHALASLRRVEYSPRAGQVVGEGLL